MSISSVGVDKALTQFHMVDVVSNGVPGTDYASIALIRDGVDANQVVHLRDLSKARVDATQCSLSCRYNPNTKKTYYRIVLNCAMLQSTATDLRRENVFDAKFTFREDASFTQRLECINTAIQLLAELKSDITNGLSPV